MLDAAKRLADTVLVELGEKAPARNKQAVVPKESPLPPPPDTPSIAMKDRAAACLASMLRIKVVDQRDGSHRLFVAACRCVEHDLDAAAALGTIRKYARQRPFPKSWSDDEILRRVRDADKQCRRGQALQVASNGCIALGSREPASGKLVLSPTRTLPTAQAFVRDFHTHPDGRALVCYAGLLMEWRDNRYAEVEDGAAKQVLQSWLHDALRYYYNPNTKMLELVDFQSNPSTVRSALESTKAFVHLPVTTPCPSWLVDADERPRRRGKGTDR